MRLIEWEVQEDNYQDQIIVPNEQREIAEEEGITVDNKKKVAVQVTNLSTGEVYFWVLAITGNLQIYMPVEIRQMLKGAGKIKIQIIGA